MGTDPRYQELLAKIDTKAEDLQKMHGQAISCRLACHSCCQPHLTVFPVEAAHIRQHLTENPALAALVQTNEASDPHQGSRCAFLSGEGACLIYEARPVVCRTHGFPLEIREEERVFRDVCPLNFSELSLAALPGKAVFNLQLINTLLILINQNSQGAEASQRLPLKPSALLG